MTRKIPWTHIVLFVLTFLSTVGAGALQAGVNPFTNPLDIAVGLPFALTLMTILLSHELGHYFTSKVHHTNATLPYFIPAPSIIGTFGAFIKMRSPIQTRRALVDIGASGPVIGFFFSIVASIAGLAMSRVVQIGPDVETSLTLGNSLLFRFLSDVILGQPPEGYDILLHPVAFAGWIGLFVTSLNLIPIGQLDGGHVLFALLGRRHRTVSIVLVGVLAVLGVVYWPGWGIWAVLMLVLGVKHPPVIYWEKPLDPRRRFVSAAALVIFVITFIPSPFNISF
jgi:membrane-associated protease RseP (regulator of RpoE activity)